MLRANVGLSRKVSKDFNSTGFTVNLDGEITASISDAEAVLEQMKELFDLVEEALDQQIDRARSVDAIASRDVEHTPPATNGRQRPGPSRGTHNSNGSGYQPRPRLENGHIPDQPPNGDPATNKQINYLLNIGKRQRLTTAQLERKIAEILGQQVGLYDLTKQTAAAVIDAMTGDAANGTAGSRFQRA